MANSSEARPNAGEAHPARVWPRGLQQLPLQSETRGRVVPHVPARCVAGGAAAAWPRLWQHEFGQCPSPWLAVALGRLHASAAGAQCSPARATTAKTATAIACMPVSVRARQAERGCLNGRATGATDSRSARERSVWRLSHSPKREGSNPASFPFPGWAQAWAWCRRGIPQGV